LTKFEPDVICGWVSTSLVHILGATDRDTVLNDGQTYHINGRTIQPDEHRTRFTYDAAGRGVSVISVADVRSY
jgi:YD repeat-containing protein